MRILVHEFVSGGGLAGQPLPASLAREGGAMLSALIADLAALGHRIVATRDSRLTVSAPAGVEMVTLEPAARDAQLDRLIASVDAVWLIAPEAGGRLERLTARVERRGKAVLGSSAAAVRRAADKACLPRRLERAGVSHPKTCVLTQSDEDCENAAAAIGYPLIVKPARGAGCVGVSHVRTARDLRQAVASGRGLCGREPLLLQEYVSGAPASVSLIGDGRRAVALTVNGQSLSRGRRLSYRGGVTPLGHRQADRALDAAVRSCRALPGLRGYIGVDVVLTASDAVVIEVNPRLTTAYLGARRAIDENIAELVLAACVGSLPPPPTVRRRVRFEPDGCCSVIDGLTVSQH